jgi:Ca2+-binding EF-hand superfamily protein
MKKYDTDGDGSLSYEEFVTGLREPLNERRRRVVEKAFAQIDQANIGKIAGRDVFNLYNPAADRDFQKRLKSGEEVV